MRWLTTNGTECVFTETGLIEYRDLFQSKDDILFRINKETAGHIINPVTSELFCYDSDNHGKALIDGYRWKMTFI